MIHYFDRPSHLVSQRQNMVEKLSTNLIEAHDWMGPDSFTESLTAPTPQESMNAPEQRS